MEAKTNSLKRRSTRTRNLLSLMVITCTVLLFLTAAQAQDPASVSISSSGIVVTANPVPNFDAMNVRIMDPSGKLVVNTQSTGESVKWYPGGIAIDGLYNYDVCVITYDERADSQDDEGPSGESLSRVSGNFVVEGGAIIPEEYPAQEEPLGEQSLWRNIRNSVVKLAIKLTDILVPSAEAADLIASSNSPGVYFDDTDINPTLFEWRIGAYEFVATLSTFFLFDDQYNNFVFRIEPSNNNDNSIFVDSAGDIGLASNTLRIDKSLQWVGIGTSSRWNNDHLTISATDPQIGLRDESTNKNMAIEYDDGRFEIENNSALALVQIYDNAPYQSLVIDSQGVVNIKEAFASFSGSFSDADGLKRLFRMTSNNTNRGRTSDVGFSLKNIRENFEWVFRTAGPWRGFTATKLNTGGPELLVKNLTMNYKNASLIMGSGAYCSSTGQWINASSRDYKENIRNITTQEAIETIKHLTPVKYNFKRDTTKEDNLGFIAEDVPDLVATEGRKGMNPIEVVAILTKVVQEQQKAAQEQQKMLQEQQKMLLELKAMVKLRNTESTVK